MLRSLLRARAPLRSVRSARPVRSLGRLQYSTGGPKGENHKGALLKLVLISLGGFGAFAFATRYLDKAPNNELTEEQYENIKNKGTKRAFTPKEAFVVFVLGGPGSGKGTQCDNIIRDYKFVHLSAGDLLRAEQNRDGSTTGEMIKEYIKAGKIVPQEVTIGLLRNAMSEAMAQGYHHFLIDGFPRKMDQALTFEETVVPSQFTLFFECPEEVMLQRLLKRGQTSGRSDDNIDSIRKRFKVFLDQSMPVVNYFALANRVAKLSCNQKPEEVYAQVRHELSIRGVEPK